MDPYDLPLPPNAIRTPTIEKPTPNSSPVDIWEVGLLDTSGFSHGKDRAVLFSGGDDSLALTHFVMEHDLADLVIHLDTNSAIPENTDYVRSVCEEFQWPLIILSSPMPFDRFAFRYGFSGPAQHSVAFHTFKGRALSEFYRKRNGDVKFFSGVRRLESDRRMKHIDAEVQYEDPTNGGNFRGWWLSPLLDKSDDWVIDYRETHGLPENPVSRKIHRSGDCQCLAFGHRSEELIMIEAEYPEFGRWLRNVEQRTQEYRGRLFSLREAHPEVAERIDTLRKQTRPHPMRLTILKEHFPATYEKIANISRETAILKGKTHRTSYIGHGGLSSKELRSMLAEADLKQTTLCETCNDTCSELSPAVREYMQEAKQELESRTTTQSTLTA